MRIFHLNITVTGRVQGVFFRYLTVQNAVRLGIKGYVRNQSDGSVAIEAEGDRKSLDEFVTWCRHGPPGAVVEKIRIQKSRLKNHSGFNIRF